MTTSIEALEQRVADLEREVRELKREKVPLRERFPGRLGELAEKIPMIRQALENHPPPEYFEQLRRDLGIDHVKPIGALALQALLIEHGHDPNSNETSRMLIETRDEER